MSESIPSHFNSKSTPFSEQMFRLRLNAEIFCPEDLITSLKLKLKLDAQHCLGQQNIHSRTHAVESKLMPLKYVILDFEGYFVKLAGILIHDTVFQFYIAEQKHQPLFYELLFDTLKMLKEFYIVTFSNWEGRFISILKHELMGSHDDEEVKFMDSLKIINIQEVYYESLAAGLFSIGEVIGDDPLFRDSSQVDLLFKMKRLDIIAQHNENCLVNTNILFNKRYLKENLLMAPKIYLRSLNHIKTKMFIKIGAKQCEFTTVNHDPS